MLSDVFGCGSMRDQRVDQGAVVTPLLRVEVRPRKPVRVAVDVHEPLAHDDAPTRVAVAPLGAVVVLFDEHEPSAHEAEPSRELVLPAAVVVELDELQLLSAQVAVPVWVAPRALLDDVVRVIAEASVPTTAVNSTTASRADLIRGLFMMIP